jgi:hypothetical protein
MGDDSIIYINLVSPCVCDGGFGGWGKGKAGEAAGHRGGASTGGGELDGCIMHQVHTSRNLMAMIRETSAQLFQYVVNVMHYLEMRLIPHKRWGKETYRCIKGSYKQSKELGPRSLHEGQVKGRKLVPKDQ